MKEINVCEEHIDIAIEIILDQNKLPLVEENKENKTCERCEQKAIYTVKSGDSFED